MAKRTWVFSVIPIILFGLIVAVAAFIATGTFIKEKALIGYQGRVTYEAMQLYGRIEALDRMLHSLSHDASGDTVTQEKFADLSEIALDAAPYVDALYWVPRVSLENIENFQIRLNAVYPDGETELPYNAQSGDEGNTAIEKPLYFPVLYGSAIPDTVFAPGVDVSEFSNMQRSMEFSAREDTVTAVMLQSASSESSPVLVLIIPVNEEFAPQTMNPPDVYHGASGFLVLQVNLPGLFMAGMSREYDTALDYYLYFENEITGPALVFADRLENGSDPEMPLMGDLRESDHVQDQFVAAAANWYILAGDHGAATSPVMLWRPWIAAFIALLAALVVAWAVIRFVQAEMTVSAVVRRRSKDFDISQTEVAKSENRLRSILGNVLDGIITINTEGQIENINSAALSMFGYKEEEVIGRNVGILMPEPFRSNHDDYIRTYLKTGTAKILGQKREVNAQKKNGEVFPIELAVSEVERNEEPHFFIAILRDITDRRRVDMLKNEFVSTVSHELRTPLTSIRGSLGIVVNGLAGQLPEKALKLLKIAHQNAERLVGLVNDILDIERIESGQMEYTYTDVHVNELIQKAVDANEAYGQQFEVTFVAHPSQDDIQVHGDLERLMQVMNNLLSNAAKFSPKGGEVEIWVRREGDFVRIVIEDHGDGIPEAFRDQIFQRFAQADSSDTRAKGGTGLGLYIVKKIIERHGGRVGFETEEGKGSKFYFELPELNQPDHVQSENDTVSVRKKVLVCEDDRSIAEYIRAVFEDENLDVDVVKTAQEAFRAVASGQYDALTVDLMLPDRDGVSLIRALRRTEVGSSMPIAVISRRAEEGVKKLGHGALGITSWIQKPIREEKLRLSARMLKTSRAEISHRVLCFCDDPGLISTLTNRLENVAFVVGIKTVTDAKAQIKNNHFDVILVDTDIGNAEGLKWAKGLDKEDIKDAALIAYGHLDKEEELKKTGFKYIFEREKTEPEQLIDCILQELDVETAKEVKSNKKGRIKKQTHKKKKGNPKPGADKASAKREKPEAGKEA